MSETTNIQFAGEKLRVDGTIIEVAGQLAAAGPSGLSQVTKGDDVFLVNAAQVLYLEGRAGVTSSF